MVIYLAAPYTKHTKENRQFYFEIQCKLVAELFNKGVYVFAPLIQAHPVASRYNLPPNWDYWKEYDEKFLSICNELWVLMFPGWDESEGVRAEIEIAKQLNLPIKYMEIKYNTK